MDERLTDADWALLTHLHGATEAAQARVDALPEVQAAQQAFAAYNAFRQKLWREYGLTEADMVADGAIVRDPATQRTGHTPRLAAVE